MTRGEKTKLFEKMLELEHLAYKDNPQHTERSYDQMNGAFLMLDAIGLGSEYIHWACGK